MREAVVLGLLVILLSTILATAVFGLIQVVSFLITLLSPANLISYTTG